MFISLLLLDLSFQLYLSTWCISGFFGLLNIFFILLLLSGNFLFPMLCPMMHNTNCVEWLQMACSLIAFTPHLIHLHHLRHTPFMHTKVHFVVVCEGFWWTPLAKNHVWFSEAMRSEGILTFIYSYKPNHICDLEFLMQQKIHMQTFELQGLNIWLTGVPFILYSLLSLCCIASYR